MATSSTTSPPAGVVAVIGTQFCAPSTVSLTVTKKFVFLFGVEYRVTDVDGIVVFSIKSPSFSLRFRRVLVDSYGNPLATLQHKISIWHGRFRLYRGDSSDDRDLIFDAKKTSTMSLNSDIGIFLPQNTDQHVCDFKMKGKYYKRSGTIYLGNTDTVIAQIKKQNTMKNWLLGKCIFEVTVQPHVDYAFIVSLFIILDKIHEDRDAQERIAQTNAGTSLNMARAS